MTADPELGTAIAKAHGLANKQSLSGYVADNAHIIQAALGRGVPWKVITKAVVDLGILDANGKPPQLNAVYEAYRRLQAKQRADGKKLKGRANG